MSSGRTIAIEAGTLLTPGRRLSPGRLIIDGSSIAEVGVAGAVRIPAGMDTIDASQLVVTPGFIDPHIHGCGGVDVMDGTWESLNAVSRIVARHGTTTFLPTTVSSPAEILSQAVKKLGSVLTKPFDGATPAGIHLEGPSSVQRSGEHTRRQTLPHQTWTSWKNGSGRPDNPFAW